MTLRNISDTERYGTVRQLSVLVQAIIDRANERLSSKVTLDTVSLERLIEEEEAAKAYRAEFERKQQQACEAKAKEAVGDEEGPLEDARPEPAPEPTAAPTVAPVSPQVQGISGRVLYAVPPKKTRRRGEKPGCVYLLLHGPPIPPPSSKVTADDATTATSESYSRELAKRQSLLERVLEAMMAVAAEDARTKQEFAGCAVEESLNGKAWRPNLGTDRLSDTLFESPDYLEFLKRQAAANQARKARPKPSPGGANGLFATTAASEPAVAELVKHLLKKQEMQRKNKNARRKAMDSAKRAGDAANKATQNGAPPKKRRNKKKKAGSKKGGSGGGTTTSKPVTG